MKVIGLTGGIAMGKSTAAAMLRYLQIPVHDADAVVHALYARGGAGVKAVREHFPETLVDGAVDRTRLRERVVGQPKALARLESLIHPLVRQHTASWLREHALRRARLVVLDIPLLFETERHREVQEIWIVTCPAFVQRQRALARPGMDARRLDAILARQTPQAQRLRAADRIFPTGNGKPALFQALRRALKRF